MSKLCYFLFFAILLVLGCEKSTTNNETPAFELLRKNTTGLDFENVVKQSNTFNVFTYMYFFNGGGIAAGDFNNDGLTDIYFTNNMGPNKLFINEGDMHFKDITEVADVAGMEGWTSGVTTVDINNDGLLDIYVSQIGDYQEIKGQNQLYVNQGITDGVPSFRDESIRYGLDLIGFGTQAVFFDYDLDGDLDMYQLNHSLHQNGTFGPKKDFEGTQHPLSGDKLMRNDDGKFVEVTMQAGIKSTVIGYGLGICVSDINLDGWPDIYVGNDFHENDYLYVNQKNGTFKEVLTEEMTHTSRFSMGVDIADINNDGWNEVITLDMLAEDPFILKSSLGEDGFDIFKFKIGFGYNHQFARNNLQFNLGDPDGKGSQFSEIGMFSGIYATDWSWAPLFFDFDQDGYKDLFISNGIPRRMNDIDYINYRESHELEYKANGNQITENDLKVVDMMPKIKLPNKFFRNNGNLSFEELDKQLGLGAPTFSNGAAYADFDNDGDLDVVVNNFEDEPYLYKNLSIENGQTGDYLSLVLKGSPQNLQAVGARAIVFKRNNLQLLTAENFPVRGYESSCPAGIHLGVGQANEVDSVVLVWPDGTFQKLGNNVFNKKTEVVWKAGLPKFDFSILKPKQNYIADFQDVTKKTGIEFTHKENPFVEFNREKLIPHMVSSEGPALAVGDVNGDGREDVFFGSSKREQSQLFYQKSDGTFYKDTPASILQDSVFEDVDAVFTDLENDGDLDLVIAAGGNEYKGENEPMRQRAYLNQGNGQFKRFDFPEIFMTASCVLPADFDGDGLTDLFFGARATPWKYGIAPQSALLKNMGNGQFKNVAAEMCPELEQAGHVKNGDWMDVDGDGDLDLLLVVEWEPLTIYLNENGQFIKQPINDLSGWWNFAQPYDFDGDGDVDILAGNTGKNSRFHPSKNEPIRMYVNDFDENDQTEQVLTYFINGKEEPFANYADITKQLVHLKKKYLLSKDFAKASLDDLFGQQKIKESLVYEANTFESMYFENKGDLSFTAIPLPDQLQLSTLNAAQLFDVNQDGKTEVILAGNFYDCNIEMGRYDAEFGHVLSIGKNGILEAYPLGNLRIKDQVRRIEPIKIGNETLFIFAKNNEAAQILSINNSSLSQ